jgi:hypothetical protein
VLLRRQWLKMVGVDATLLFADMMKVHPVVDGLPKRVVSDSVGMRGDRISSF